MIDNVYDDVVRNPSDPTQAVGQPTQVGESEGDGGDGRVGESEGERDGEES